MNTLVIVRAVQDPLGITVNRKAQKVFVNREQTVCNPADRNALEAALRLGGRVTAVAFGAGPAEQVLRDARALGAQRALRLDDPAWAGADAYVAANTLKAVVQFLGDIDLVVGGAEVLDADLAQVGPRLAQALGWNFAADAHQVTVDAGAARFMAWHAGAFRQAAVALPAVLAVAVNSNKPRLPAGKDLINIYTDPGAVETLTAADLALDAAALTPLSEPRGQAFPAEREPGRRLEGDIAAQLAALVRQV